SLHYSPCDPRALHFPTRRSSDLDGRAAKELFEEAVNLAAFAVDVISLQVEQGVGLPLGHAAGEHGLALLLGGDIHVLDIAAGMRSEEHTSELQSRSELVCRLLLE